MICASPLFARKKDRPPQINATPGHGVATGLYAREVCFPARPQNFHLHLLLSDAKLGSSQD